MNKQQEKLLVAGMCGLIATVAVGWMAEPTLAAGYHVDQLAQVTGVAPGDRLNVRKWPAPHSQQVGAFDPHSHVWVERCIEKPGSDWCLVDARETKGWVNARYLTLRHDWDL